MEACLVTHKQADKRNNQLFYLVHCSSSFSPEAQLCRGHNSQTPPTALPRGGRVQETGPQLRQLPQ